MDNLPNEILKNIVEYLSSPFDVIELSNSCKKLHLQLPLIISAPLQIPTELSKSGFKVPYHPQETVHSIAISFIWKYFGRGSRKGTVSVIATTADSLPSKGAERILHTSYIDLRANRSLRIIFKPRSNESYYIKYTDKRSNSGDHIYHIKTQTLAFGQTNVNDLPCFGMAHHFFVKMTTCVSHEILDEAMGKVKETVGATFDDSSMFGPMSLGSHDDNLSIGSFDDIMLDAIDM
mmetsp:Transcript_27554/g.58223  ORF Transcript_27554/g.58223 Transcript_27554/m.58223 type:complete len:234 (+) Transcript_27554:204-905(+)